MRNEGAAAIAKLEAAEFKVGPMAIVATSRKELRNHLRPSATVHSDPFEAALSAECRKQQTGPPTTRHAGKLQRIA